MHTVLVTGASAGIGEECARLFYRQGAKLILLARRIERLKSFAAKLDQKRVACIECDVQSLASVGAIEKQIPEDFKAVDVLINNAGLALGLGPAYETDLKDWDTMIDTNVKGLLYVTRAFLPGMVSRAKGHVVNIGSVAGSAPYRGGNVYSGTKAFVSSFSDCLRADLLGTPIRVTNIEPGLTQTEFSVVRFKGDTTRAAKTYANKHALSAEDVAQAVLWAVSQPPHVNINRIELMPVCQAFEGFKTVENL